MAVFDVSQSVIAQAGGLIQGSTDVSTDMLAELETSLEAMDSVSYTHLDVYKRQGLVVAEKEKQTFVVAVFQKSGGRK